MRLDPLVVGMVLLAALMHASWNAVVKSDRDRLISFALMQATGMAMGLIVVAATSLPAAAAWPYLALSALVHYAYYYLLLAAYAHGDLSHVYPIARGLGPMLVASFSGLIIGEHLSTVELIGVALVSSGVAGLALARGLPRGADGRATGFAVLTGVTIAGYTIVDGLGVRASGDALAYIGWLNVVEGPGVVVIMVMRRPWPVMAAYLRTQWWRGTVGGVIAATGYGISIWAMSLGAVAHVSALRETSVLFAAIIGTALMGERFGRWRVGAAAIVVAGLLLMHLPIGR
jgi:uncharacterized membrane protein